jgi:dipeptidyl aminopeptidase/acylaminoacyl peptidase
VQAVVDMYGPVDALKELQYVETQPSGATTAAQEMQEFLGTVTPAQQQRILAASSAVTYVKHGDPPFLILQGDVDPIVPESQSQELAGLLKANGVPVQLIIVKGGSHGLEQAGEQPDEAQLIPVIIQWIASVIGPN